MPRYSKSKVSLLNKQCQFFSVIGWVLQNISTCLESQVFHREIQKNALFLNNLTLNFGFFVKQLAINKVATLVTHHLAFLLKKLANNKVATLVTPQSAAFSVSWMI